MVSLESHLNALDFVTQLETVRDLLLRQDATQATVSLWGNRIVTVDGFSGSVYLDYLVCDIYNATIVIDRDNQATDEQRAMADQIQGKLREFYARTDVEIDNSNCLTWILARMREWMQNVGGLNPYTPRFYVESVTWIGARDALA